MHVNTHFQSSSPRLLAILQQLKARGCRLTPQRVAILQAMLTNAEHPTAEQIHTRVKDQFPMTSLATVYNTLDLLKEMGALLEIELGHGSSRFDGVNPYPHPHLICTRCHTILDTNIPHLQTVTDVVSQMTGFMVTGHRFDIFGICPTCQTIG